MDQRSDEGEFGVASCLQVAAFLLWHLASFALNTALVVFVLRNHFGKAGPALDPATIAALAATIAAINLALLVMSLVGKGKFSGQGNLLVVLPPALNLTVAMVVFAGAIIFR